MRLQVAAIVVNWNSNALLARCLQCLDVQSVPFSRILVVDNASKICPAIPDGTKTELIALDENTGFARANNLAIAEVLDCDLVALVNPDAFLDKYWLENMLEAASRYAVAASFASTLIQDRERDFLDGGGDVYHASGMCWRSDHGRALVNANLRPREIFSPCAAAALYRRSALVEVGGFDEAFFCYMEDVDLGFRLRLAGYASVLVPEARAFHVGSATSGGQRSAFAVYYGHRNLIWCYVKNMPLPFLLLFLPLHLIANFFAVLLYTRRGLGAVILRAKLDALRGVPSVIRKRRHIQRSRRIGLATVWRLLDKRFLPR